MREAIFYKNLSFENPIKSIFEGEWYLMAKFNAGDKAFIIESTIFIKEVEVVKNTGGFVTIRYPNSSGSFGVRKSRLFLQKMKLNNK